MILKVHPTYTMRVIQKVPVKDFDDAIDKAKELSIKYKTTRDRNYNYGYKIYCYVRSMAGQIKTNEND